MAIQFWSINGIRHILFRALFGNKIAMDPKCCCTGVTPCCCDTGIVPLDLTATLSAPGCTGPIDGLVVTLKPTANPVAFCEAWVGNRSVACDPANVPNVGISVRCNPNLPDRGSSSPCDKYELSIQYASSGCATNTATVRIEEGCSCQPLSLVFKVPGPRPGPFTPTECNCCGDPPATITITVTL